MASNLRTTIRRLHGRGTEKSPFFMMTLENSQLINGRSLSLLLPSSFEDLVGLRDALDEIVERRSDSVVITSKVPGQLPFTEIEEEKKGD
jgi:hypothetical protein